MEQELHERLLATNARYTDGISNAKPIAVKRPISTVEEKLAVERRNELDSTSGPTAYLSAEADYGPDLFDILIFFRGPTVEVSSNLGSSI